MMVAVVLMHWPRVPREYTEEQRLADLERVSGVPWRQMEFRPPA